jgi:hypothetical protein
MATERADVEMMAALTPEMGQMAEVKAYRQSSSGRG